MDWQATLNANFNKNRKYVQPRDSYSTALSPAEETAFRAWVKANKVPFNPNDSVSDYDMRGFYKGLQSNDPEARSAINPNDKQLHFSDKWKTPYHKSFSNESMYATPNAPAWINDFQLADPTTGQVVFDERTPAQKLYGKQ